MNVGSLVLLEEASWRMAEKRELYSTPLFPGFPWYTVVSEVREEENNPTLDVTRRHVIPYFYTFRVFVKGRWVGRSLVDVYTEEHSHHSRDYYEACVKRGRLQRQPRLRCNTKRNHMKRSHTAVDTIWTTRSSTENDMQQLEEQGPSEEGGDILLHGDVVLHTVHRHEIPIHIGSSGVDPVVLSAVCIKEYGLILVRKPAGLPTHATGRYFMNSCTAMMEYVLAPKRIKAWLIGMDALLQSLVSTSCLCDKEREELLAYYSQGEQEDEYVAIERLPRPCHRLDKVTSGVLLLVCYLARVHGLFPQRAVAASGPRYMENTEEKNNAKSTAGSGLFVLPGDCNKEYEASGFKCSDEAVRQASGGVVFASQLRQYKFSEVAAEGDTADQRSNPGSKEVFYQDAVTLCQPVRYYGRGSGPEGTATYGGREESLIHCVPFSGRLHQIRMHLSDWYHPIVGDVTYYVCENETDAHRRDRRTLFFCEEELPGSYREAFHKHDDLCWECNQRLPIASYDNSNGSTVALHAWRYEIDHHLLLSREGSVHCDSEQDTGCGAAGQACIVDTALSVHCCWGDVISKVTRSVERRGSVVIFSAPPPDWALE
uniref:Uncharacterized protein n=1 Tax=Trypanosoma vivax (strain Y486) TaxID=1055687 RepID=G0TXM2_TRYVY|nr:conserved hypothetical protein, fragment [Trypanosoma vivax Y486]